MSKYATDYEHVAAGQTAQVMGPSGAIGDILMRLICKVSAAATSAVDIKDGSDSAINVLAANTPVGTIVVELQVRSRTGAWQVTTAAGVAVLAIGKFT